MLRNFLAITCVVAALQFANSAQAQCVNGKCEQYPGGELKQWPLPAAKPVFATPVRSTLYWFFTPKGYVQGYLVRPVTAYTPEQIRSNAAYWNEQAARLAPQPIVQGRP